MSLGGGGSIDRSQACTSDTSINDDGQRRAICQASLRNITTVVAAGNSQVDLDRTFPAAFPEALTVTAINDADGRPGGDSNAGFSNFANASDPYHVAHTIAAPGVSITSTYRYGGYATMSGTSMACPHVAGIVALCIKNGGVDGPCAGMTPPRVSVCCHHNTRRAAPSMHGCACCHAVACW